MSPHKLSKAEAPSGYRFHINYVVMTHNFQSPHRLSTELQPHISVCLLGASPWMAKALHTLPGPKRNSWFPAPALQNTRFPPPCPSQKTPDHHTDAEAKVPGVTLGLSEPYPLATHHHRVSHLDACKDWAPHFHSRPPQSTLPAALGESYFKGQLGHATHLFKKPQ